MILIIAEQRDGALNRASWEPIAAAQQLRQAAKVVVLGKPGVGSAVGNELAAAAVDEVIVAEHDLLATYTADAYTTVLAEIIQAEQPAMVWLPHTYQTRDFAPKLASRLDRALITDCIEVKPNGDAFAFVRPMFQAKLAADVVPQGPTPHLVTFQIGAYRADAVTRGAAPAPVRAVTVNLAASDIRQKPEAPFREAKQAVDLTQAERIVSVGRGIKAQ